MYGLFDFRIFYSGSSEMRLAAAGRVPHLQYRIVYRSSR